MAGREKWKVAPDNCGKGIPGSGGSVTVGWCVDDVIEKALHRGGGHMQPCVGRAVIDEYRAVLVNYPAV
jgi:hypothetical protein